MPNELFRSLPSVERMLTTSTATRLSVELGRDRVRDILREIIEDLRQEISAGSRQISVEQDSGAGDLADVMAATVERELTERAKIAATPSLRRVINATGVVIHTNLGRAPLAKAALDAMSEVSSHYSNLEYDLELGERGRREVHCQRLIARLAGAESAIVANNNAAAVLLVLNTLAQSGEVIVSRGELIEIGGSFRIPEVMEKSGARLREVGTTNRTRIEDYANAITGDTRLIMRVHPSNYRIVGFTSRPSVEEVAELANRADIPSFEDLGSGCLIDLTPYGVVDEPVVAKSIEAGISVVSFSGDKMLGGPQAGIIAGTDSIISRVRRNPLMRALRVDKMTYSALEATMRLYERGVAQSEVPVVRAIAASAEELASRAESFARLLEQRTSFLARLRDGRSVVGGGSAPGVLLKTTLVAVSHARLTADSIASALRRHKIPVIARVEDGELVIDLRTVRQDEETVIIDALAATVSAGLSQEVAAAARDV